LKSEIIKGVNTIPKFVIEREIPGAGSLNQQELQGVSQTSCNVLRKLGPQIQWVQSYVTADKVYCVYIAPNEEMIRGHSTLSGIPANRISESQVGYRSDNCGNRETISRGWFKDGVIQPGGLADSSRWLKRSEDHRWRQ